jgi:hypothetical protein
MKRTFATPLAFKAALEARLAERAQGGGRTINRVRQLLVTQRFLVRVVETLDAVVLKGGIVMELRLDRTRATRDVDLRVNASPDDLLDRLREAARRDVGDQLVFEVERDADLPIIEAEGLRFEGQRFRVRTTLAGRRYADAFGVDVAIGEPIVGTPTEVVGDDLLRFVGIPAPVFRAYPVPTHVAEKLHAYTMPRPKPNSRVKDLPDIALLATVADLDASALAAAIRETFAHRATHLPPGSLPEPAVAWEPVYARMATADGLPWGTLAELTRAVQAFLDPVLAGADGKWDPEAWIWRQGRSGFEPENAEHDASVSPADDP